MPWRKKRERENKRRSVSRMLGMSKRGKLDLAEMTKVL